MRNISKANELLREAAKMLDLMPLNACGYFASTKLKNTSISTSEKESLMRDWEKIGNDMRKIIPPCGNNFK